MGCHPVFDPLIETEWTSPAPPTFVIKTKLKYEWPFIVNLTPPFFTQGTLYIQNKFRHFLVEYIIQFKF
ncbi:hypothetical protein Hanom_Chr14g01330141 [Helianthus anomalus]